MKNKFGQVDVIIQFQDNDTMGRYVETEEYILEFERIHKILSEYEFYDLFKYGIEEKEKITKSLEERNNLIFATYTTFPVTINKEGTILNKKKLKNNIKELQNDLDNIIKSNLFTFRLFLDDDIYNIEEE